MRTLVSHLFIVTLVVVTSAWLYCRLPQVSTPPTPPKPVVIQSQGPTVERLEQLSHLVVTRVYVADVLVGEGRGARGVWLVFGDALIAADLSKAVIVEKDEAAKRATIRLPEPCVLQARVDHERTQTWEVRTTAWIPWTADKDSLRDQVMAHAQRLVVHAAASKENIERAKASAAAAVKGFYAEVGWGVGVEWTERPVSEALSSLAISN